MCCPGMVLAWSSQTSVHRACRFEGRGSVHGARWVSGSPPRPLETETRAVLGMT